MRGNWVPSADGGCEFDSNFHQLMLLRGKDDPNILDVMKRKTCKYTDHHIQDELMKIVKLVIQLEMQGILHWKQMR